MPQGAAGPERGVEMPNLTTSAAHEGPELATTSAAAAKSVPEARGTHCFIAITSWSAGRTSIARNYRDAGRPCQTLSPARDPSDDSVGEKSLRLQGIPDSVICWAAPPGQAEVASLTLEAGRPTVPASGRRWRWRRARIPSRSWYGG